jgi:two-component system CheB/CheR fusion protein
MVPEAQRREAGEKLEPAQKGEVVSPFEAVHLTREGKPIDVWVSHAPIYDEHGLLVGCSSIARDITQRKRDELQVRQALHMRDQFMAMLSHELRNPLAALLNAATLLTGQPKGDRAERALSTIGRQCKHMARLLDDLLDVSRMRQDEIELRKQNLDLRTTVEAAVESVRPLADAAGLKLEIDLPAEPITVYGDPTRLQQVEANLLTNSVKYTQAGGHIKVSATVESGQAVLRVKDDGSGIATHMLDRIFEPFVRAVDDDTPVHRKQSSGMGLGLALVRSFVRAHGGDVRAFSDGPGKGAELVVRLPLGEKARPLVVRDGISSRRADESIVLVEDQDDSRMLLSEILQDAGYAVLAAADGQQAIDLIDKHRPSLAVVDIGLPVMSGYDVARSVRQRLGPGDIFLVALTGYGQQQDRESVLRAGFDQHLVKPVESETLLEVLRKRRTLRDGPGPE